MRKRFLLNLMLVAGLLLPAISLLPVISQGGTAEAISPIAGYSSAISVVIPHTANQSVTGYCNAFLKEAVSPWDDVNWIAGNQDTLAADDANYAYFTQAFSLGNYSYVLNCTNFGLAIPSGAIINGIKVSIDKRNGNNDIVDALVQLTKNGSGLVGDNKADVDTHWSLVDTIVTYGGATDLWNTTWTAENLSTTSFGVRIAVAAHSDINCDAYIDQVKVDVYYQLPTLADYQMELHIAKGNSSTVYKNTGGTITTNGSTTVHTWTAGFTTGFDEGYLFYVARSGNISVEAWGAGGGGGYRSTFGGGGGGGGAYAATMNVPVIAGTYYSVVLGHGGMKDPSSNTVTHSSSFNGSTVVAVGGTSVSANSGGAGGVAANCIGDIKMAGGAGGGSNATSDSSGGGGGAGGPDGAGTAGGTAGVSIGGAGGNGSNGSGGAGGAAPPASTGGNGSAGTSHLRGGGGGGGNSVDNYVGGNGGTPGGGGGGMDAWVSGSIAGNYSYGGGGQVIVTCETADFLEETNRNILYAENKCLNWPYDVRFTTADGTPLDFWREESDDTDGTWWVKIPSISNYPDDTTIYINVGDADATDASDGDATFLFFDHFDDLSQWNTIAGFPNVSSSVVSLTDATMNSQQTWIESKTTYGMNTALRSRTNFSPSNGIYNYYRSFVGYQSGGYTSVWVKPYVMYLADDAGIRLRAGVTADATVSGTNGRGYWATIDLRRGSTSLASVYTDDVLQATIATQIPTTSIPINLWNQGYTSGTVNSKHECDWVCVRNYVFYDPVFTTWGSWESPTPYLTTSSGDGGNVSTPGEGTYAYNMSEVVNISATADDFYSFGNWSGDVSAITDVNSSSTTITVSSNCSIVANFVETVVVFPDEALETAVRSALGVPSGDIHELDLQGVTSFNATSLGIEDLTGMEYWVPLETLNLSTNDIVDVAPLAPLVDLTYLDLNDNSVSNISPIAMESGDLFVKSNPLSSKAYTTYIPALLGGGVDVDYDEQPALAISVSPISKNFGKMYANTSYWSNGSTPTFPLDDAECYFIITNEGSATINISINASDFTGGAGWALTSGAPGSGEARMKAGVSGDANEGAMIILTASPASFMTSMAGNASVSWELKLETGIFTDGVVKESHITLVAVEDA
jgi:hypothetical protein